MSKKVHSLDWQIGGRVTQLHTFKQRRGEINFRTYKNNNYLHSLNIAARKLGLLQKRQTNLRYATGIEGLKY